MNAAAIIKQAKRLAIKIGSSLLADGKAGLRHDWMAALARDIARARRDGQQIVLISSGAIAAGQAILRLRGRTARALKLEESQAAAAAGQIDLAHGWRAALAEQNIIAAQILLTLDDTKDRRRYLNARATLRALLALNALPVVNENDTVATSEIRYGDNDRLAAHVAAMMDADALILFSQIDGFYSCDPALGQGRHIERIKTITPEIESMAGGAGSELSRGGMKTKLQAAAIAAAAGCHTLIAPGYDPHPLRALLEGGRCSWFEASVRPQTARKHWIASSLRPRGDLWADSGAVKAIAAGRSLLPAGVSKIEGAFERGDPVRVRALEGGRVCAIGLVAYSAADARAIAGRKSEDIARILNWRGRDEMIHRDDLVMMERD